MIAEPLVSIVVTTKNEGDVIGRLLQSIESQSYRRIETIIVDNYSTDNTLDISRKFTNKVYQMGPERSAQRNFGADNAKGKYLLFLDADMELSSTVVEECIQVATNNNFGAAIIPEVSVGKTYWEKVKAFERSFYEAHGSRWTDAARFFKRDVFYACGKYDESITGPEDWDLSETVRGQDYQINRIKSVIFHHERIPNPFKMAKKMYYYGLKAHRSINKQKTGVLSPKTVYFLRREFYLQWFRFLTHPILSLGLFVLLFMQLLGGGLGYFVGKLQNA
jgi:glycosyltransferase involved in cell wall biosynthesis